MRKKKLAIFTAAVGFFTLCNVFLYTRRLRADEMARFWHWSASSFYSSAAYHRSMNGSSANSSSSTDLCQFALNVSDLLDLAHPCVVNNQHQSINSSNSMHNTSILNSPAHNNNKNNNNKSHKNINNNETGSGGSGGGGEKSSNVKTKAYFVLQNRTYVVDLNETEVYTELRDSAHNRTLTLTFSQSLFLREDGKTVVSPETSTSSEVSSNGSRSGNVSGSVGLTALNAHPFQYLINVKGLCSGRKSPLMLVILVATAVEHAAQRQAIRETWGSFAKKLPDVALAFVMGRPVNHNAQGAVMKEALTHADIIQEDFLDTYKNLTLKTVMLLKWANVHCAETKYVMKADDDMFVNVPNLLKYLRSLRQNKSQLFGRLVKGARPLRSKSSKYYVPESEYKEKVYPDYLSGTSYVMSADVAPKLYAISKITPMFFFEDVFITGICAKKAGIARRNHIGFVYYKRPVKGCSYLRVITGHNNTPNDLRKIWKDLQRKVIKC